MIGVVGAGNFGTAIAHCLARNGHRVTLVSRNQAGVDALNRSDTMIGYPTVAKPDTLDATTDIMALKNVHYIVLSVPTQYLRLFLTETVSLYDGQSFLLLQKGIEKETAQLPSHILQSFGIHALTVLGGPNFADEILTEVPTATTLASKDLTLAVRWAELLQSPTFRPYTHQDMMGVHVGGAIKNVIAIACGVVKGLALGENTLATVITRGLAEMVRLGVAMGAAAETFLGLSGIGDLTLTCHSLKSRNVRFGVALGTNQPWDEAVQGTAEGFHTAFSIETLMRQYAIDMPICASVIRLVRKEVSAQEAISTLMNRTLKHEGE